MTLQEYFLKKTEVEQKFYSGNITIEQALSEINSMVKTVEELEIPEITTDDLNRNFKVISEYGEKYDEYDDEYED